MRLTCSAILFPKKLTMQRHINTVTRACFHHIRRLKQISQLLGKDVAAGLVSAFILSRLDYCDAVLTGLPKSTIAPLQRVQNAAARLVARLGTSRSPLFACSTSYHLQTVSDDASCQHRSCPGVSHQQRNCNTQRRLTLPPAF